jgi:hypothetical protein
VRLNVDSRRFNTLTDFFSVATGKRPTPQHQFVGNNAEGKVVDRIGVIFSVENLWGHVARCSACVCSVIFTPGPGNTEIGDSDVPMFVHDDVFGLYVSVYNLVAMDVLEAEDEAAYKKLGQGLAKVFTCTEVVPQFAPREVVHNKIQVFLVLKSVVHVDNVIVSKLR